MASPETWKIGEAGQFTGGVKRVLGTGVCKDWSVLSKGGCARAEMGGWMGLGECLAGQNKKSVTHTGTSESNWRVLSRGSKCSGLFSPRRSEQREVHQSTG